MLEAVVGMEPVRAVLQKIRSVCVEMPQQLIKALKSDPFCVMLLAAVAF